MDRLARDATADRQPEGPGEPPISRDPRRLPPHVALSTSSLYPQGVPETFEAATRLGYDGVEVLVTHEHRRPADHQLLDGVPEVPDPHLHHPRAHAAVHPTGVGRVLTVQMAAKLTTRWAQRWWWRCHPPFRWQRKYAKNFVAGVREVSA
ncbi:hypothetical protein QJS66_18835 [Kocuria rhizophila]|nr:hypothetical protein QJS66_18835 [Kocuria rhizophila]